MLLGNDCKLGLESCMGIQIDMTDFLIEQEVMFDIVVDRDNEI